MFEKFQNLIESLCALIKFNEPARIVSGEPFFVNHVMFTLIYDPEVDEERIFLFVQFGDIPSTNAAEVLAALLSNNHLGYMGNGPGFSISPSTGKLNYCRHLKLVKTDASSLASLLVYFSNKVVEWRSTYFLATNSDKKSHIQQKLSEKFKS